MQPHGQLLCFMLLHISNSSVNASLVEHVLYLADLMSAICLSHLLLIVHRYIYSRYSPVFGILLCHQRILCGNVAQDTHYTPGFHYQNPLQRPPTSPRHNLDPRLGTSIRQLPSCRILEQHIPQEARLMSQHQVSQIQTINVNILELRDSRTSLEYNIISIQSRLRLI